MIIKKIREFIGIKKLRSFDSFGTKLKVISNLLFNKLFLVQVIPHIILLVNIFFLLLTGFVALESVLEGLPENHPTYIRLWRDCEPFMVSMKMFEDGFDNLEAMEDVYLLMNKEEGLGELDQYIKDGMIKYKIWIIGTSNDMVDVNAKVAKFANHYGGLINKCKTNIAHYRHFLWYYSKHPDVPMVKVLLNFNLKVLNILEGNVDFWKQLWSESQYDLLRKAFLEKGNKKK